MIGGEKYVRKRKKIAASIAARIKGGQNAVNIRIEEGFDVREVTRKVTQELHEQGINIDVAETGIVRQGEQTVPVIHFEGKLYDARSGKDILTDAIQEQFRQQAQRPKGKGIFDGLF